MGYWTPVPGTEFQSQFIHEALSLYPYLHTSLCFPTFSCTYGQACVVLKYSYFSPYSLFSPNRLQSELGHRLCLMSTQEPTGAKQGTENRSGVRKIGRTGDSGQLEGTWNSGQLLSCGNMGPVLPELGLFKRSQKSRFLCEMS